MRGYKTLLVPAILALAVHAAVAADDDGTFTINIQGPEDSVTTSSSNAENVRARVEPQNTRQTATNTQVRRENQRRAANATPQAPILNQANSATNAQNNAQNNATQVPSQGSYIVTSRDTLWSIASRYVPADHSVNEFQIVASIYRNNPNAFGNGNVNRLRAGRINIPALSEIARESASVGSRLLNQGSMQLPPLAAVENAQTSDTNVADSNSATENAQRVIANANSLPQYQATENVVAQARLNHQQELEQKARDELDRATGALNDQGKNTSEANSADGKDQLSADKNTANEVSTADKSQDTVDVAPRRTVADGKLDTQALRMMLEGSQKQIDMRMKEINQKLMDTIERMQKANESVTKSTDAAVAALAKQYDGMIAELQQNVTELKGEIAALDRDTTSMREMILANDEKIDAMQVSLADGKIPGESAKSDFSKAYNYMLAGFASLALMLLMLYVIFRIKIRNRNRNLENAMSELGEAKSQGDEELLSSAVEKGAVQSQVLTQDGWSEAAREVAQAEGGNDSLSEESASKHAQAMLAKAVKVETAQDKAETEAVMSKVVNDIGSKPADTFHPAEQSDEFNNDTSSTDNADMSVEISDEGTTIIDEMDYDEQDKQEQELQAQEKFEAVLSEQVERGVAQDEAQAKPATDSKKSEELKDLKFSEYEPGTEDDLSKYIGSAGSEWFNKVNEEQSTINEDDVNFKVSSEGDSVANDDKNLEDLSSQNFDEFIRSSSESSYEGSESSSEPSMSQQELADAWEKALAEQAAAQSDDATQNGAEAYPKSDASATTGSDADALSDSTLPEEQVEEKVLNEDEGSSSAQTVDPEANDKDLAQEDPKDDFQDKNDLLDDKSSYIDDLAEDNKPSALNESTQVALPDEDTKERIDEAGANGNDDISDDELSLTQSFDELNNNESLFEDNVSESKAFKNEAADAISQENTTSEDEDAENSVNEAESVEALSQDNIEYAPQDHVLDDEQSSDSHDSDLPDEAVELAQSLAQNSDHNTNDVAPEASDDTNSFDADESDNLDDEDENYQGAKASIASLFEDYPENEGGSDPEDLVAKLKIDDQAESSDTQSQALSNSDSSEDAEQATALDEQELEDEDSTANDQQASNSFDKSQETSKQTAERLFVQDFLSSLFANDDNANTDVAENTVASNAEPVNKVTESNNIATFASDNSIFADENDTPADIAVPLSDSSDKMDNTAEELTNNSSDLQNNDERVDYIEDEPSEDNEVSTATGDEVVAYQGISADDGQKAEGQKLDKQELAETEAEEAISELSPLAVTSEDTTSDEEALVDTTQDEATFDESTAVDVAFDEAPVEDQALVDDVVSKDSASEDVVPQEYAISEQSEIASGAESIASETNDATEDIAENTFYDSSDNASFDAEQDSQVDAQADEDISMSEQSLENEEILNQDSAESMSLKAPDESADYENASDEKAEKSIEDYESSLTSDHGIATWGYTDEEEFGVVADPVREIKPQSSSIDAADVEHLPEQDQLNGVPPEDRWSDLDERSEQNKSYTPFTWAVPDDDGFDVTNSKSDKTDANINAVAPKADEQEHADDEDYEPNFHNLPKHDRESFSSWDGDYRNSDIVNMLSESVPQKELDDLDLHSELSASQLQNMLSEPNEDINAKRLELIEHYLDNDELNKAQELLHELSADAHADLSLKMKAVQLIARYKDQR